MSLTQLSPRFQAFQQRNLAPKEASDLRQQAKWNAEIAKLNVPGEPRSAESALRKAAIVEAFQDLLAQTFHAAPRQTVPQIREAITQLLAGKEDDASNGVRANLETLLNLVSSQKDGKTIDASIVDKINERKQAVDWLAEAPAAAAPAPALTSEEATALRAMLNTLHAKVQDLPSDGALSAFESKGSAPLEMEEKAIFIAERLKRLVARLNTSSATSADAATREFLAKFSGTDPNGQVNIDKLSKALKTLGVVLDRPTEAVVTAEKLEKVLGPVVTFATSAE